MDDLCEITILLHGMIMMLKAEGGTGQGYRS